MKKLILLLLLILFKNIRELYCLILHNNEGNNFKFISWYHFPKTGF